MKKLLKIFAFAFLVLGLIGGVTYSADWSKQVKAGRIIGYGTISKDCDIAEITNILQHKGYKDLQVVGGEIAYVQDNSGKEKIFFQADCASNKGGTAKAEGWIDYLNPSKYGVTRVSRSK